MQCAYLLADSGPLFAADGAGRTVPQRIADERGGDGSSVVYIGASNDDRPEFAEIFEAAFSDPRFTGRRHVTLHYSAMDHMCLSNADVVVLGGGDALRGWELMRDRDMADTIAQCWLRGAVMVGVSAGAVQLGAGCLGSTGEIVETLGFVPCFVGVHDDEHEYASLATLLGQASSPSVGIGIPRGAGLIYRPEEGLIPLRGILIEMRREDGEIKRATWMASAGRAG